MKDASSITSHFSGYVTCGNWRWNTLSIREQCIPALSIPWELYNPGGMSAIMGAMHSRFEHSLGVMELTTRAFDVIVRKHGGLVEGELSQIQELRQDTLERSRQVLRLAGMCLSPAKAPLSAGFPKLYGRSAFLPTRWVIL